MECNHNALISYHYGEADNRESAWVAAHIEHCIPCRNALEEMATTSQMLKAWPDEEPQLKMHFTGAEQSRRSAWPTWLSYRRVGVLATAIAASLFLSLVSEFEFSYHNGTLDLHLAFGDAQPSAKEAPLTRADLAQLQEQALIEVADLLEQNDARHQQQLGMALNHFANELSAWRQQDLQLVDSRLRQYDWQTRSRFRRNEDVLNQLIPAQYYLDE